jgi:hypothetical protein
MRITALVVMASLASQLSAAQPAVAQDSTEATDSQELPRDRRLRIPSVEELRRQALRDRALPQPVGSTHPTKGPVITAVVVGAIVLFMVTSKRAVNAGLRGIPIPGMSGGWR